MRHHLISTNHIWTLLCKLIAVSAMLTSPSLATTLSMTVSLPDVTNVTSFTDVEGTFSPDMVDFDGSLDTIVIAFNDMKFVQLAGGVAPVLSIGMDFLDDSGLSPDPSPSSVGTLSLLDANQQVIASSSTLALYDPSGFPGHFALGADVPGVITFHGLMFEFSPLGTGPAFPGPLAFSSDYGVGGSLSVGVIPEPSTALLLAVGLAGLAAAGRRRRS